MPSHDTSDQRAADLMRAYLTADYRWQLDGHWHDVAIGLPAPGLELAFPDAQTFAMLSAWNPQSIEREEHVNRQQDELLQADLSAAGATCLPAFASAPNRSWREPSWLVFDMTQGDFDALARRYGQLGTLWWQANDSVRLRMMATRPHGVSDEPYVDWIE